MTIRHALALFIAAWLLAGCAVFGEGVAPRVAGRNAEPGKDTRLCEVSGPALTGILPMLERQEGYPPLGQVGADRAILKVIMVHGVGTPGCGARLSANLRRRRASRWSRRNRKSSRSRRSPSPARRSASSPWRGTPTSLAIARCSSSS